MQSAVSEVEPCREVCLSGREVAGILVWPLNADGSGQNDQYDHRPDAGEQREVPDRNETVVVGLIHVALPRMQLAPLNEVSEGPHRMFILLTDEYTLPAR